MDITRLYLIRHGLTNLTAGECFSGRLILSSLPGFDARGYRDRLDQSPACLNICDFKGPIHARLMLFNDVSHYMDQPLYAENHLSKWFEKTDNSLFPGGEKT
jgi:hypothetical protein